MKQDGVFRAMNRTSKGNLYILAAALLWSTGGLIMKAVPFNGIVVNFFRTVFAFLFFAAMRRSFRIKINKTILLGAFCFFASTTFYACSNKMTTAANAIVLQYTAPMFVLAMQCVRERTLPKRRDVILLTAAFFGMILFFCDQLDPGKMLGNIFGVLAGVFFAAMFVVNQMPGASNADANMLGFLMTIVIGLPFVVTEDLHFTPQIAAALVFLGTIQIGMAYYMFSKGVSLTPPVNASLISVLEAVLNPLWVFLALGERPGYFALLGAVFLIGAVVMNIAAEHRQAVLNDGEKKLSHKKV